MRNRGRAYAQNLFQRPRENNRAKYNVEVDQSTKIEQSGLTILAFANGASGAIVIPSKVKTGAFEVLRAREKSREVAHLLLFAACIYLLLERHLSQLTRIVIDVEYPGHP